MRLYMTSGIAHVQTSKRKDYDRCHSLAKKLAEAIDSSIAVEETDDFDEPYDLYEASFGICLNDYTQEEVRDVWREVKKDFKELS